MFVSLIVIFTFGVVAIGSFVSSLLIYKKNKYLSFAFSGLGILTAFVALVFATTVEDCPECKKLVSSAPYCENCGAYLDDELCECGSYISKNVNYCSECGREVNRKER